MSPTVPPIRQMATSTASSVPMPSAALDVFLDFVGDVRDDLHGLAQVVAAAFFSSTDW